MKFCDLNWVKIVGNFGTAFFVASTPIVIIDGQVRWETLLAGVVSGLFYGGIAIFQEIKTQAENTGIYMPGKQPMVTKAKMPRRQPFVTKAFMSIVTLF